MPLKPLVCPSLARTAESRGRKKKKKKVFSFFSNSFLPFGGIVRSGRGHSIFVFL